MALSGSYSLADEPLWESASPGEVFSPRFPDLPKTLRGETAGYIAALPDNYDPTKRHPVALLLTGDKGLVLDKQRSGNLLKSFFGSEDYVLLGFPLFGSEDGPPCPEHQLIVSGEAYEQLFPAFGTLIEDFRSRFDPVVDWDHSVIAGYSNGGHTMAVLWMNRDPLLADLFQNFLFLDGGGYLWGELCRSPGPEPRAASWYGKKNILFLLADRRGKNDSMLQNAHNTALLDYVDSIREAGVESWVAEVLPGATHGGLLKGPKSRPRYLPWIQEHAHIEPYTRQAPTIEAPEG